MSLKTVTTVPSAPTYQVSSGGFYATHNGIEVLKKGELTTTLNSRSQIIAADTAEEVDAEITRLELTPLPLTNSERAAAYFTSLPEEVRAPFIATFQAVYALPDDASKRIAISAVTVPPELADLKATLLAFFE